MQAIKKWKELNRLLMQCGERKANEYYEAELAGPCRLTFLHRIHSRINHLRAMRERKAYEKVAISSGGGLRDGSD